jgi:hypothetical protein
MARSGTEVRKKTVVLPLRVTPGERDLIKTKARDSGVTVSAFLRAAALGRRTRSTVEEQVINELRRLGGLQKHLFTESGGGRSKEYAQILVAITNAIERMAPDES